MPILSTCSNQDYADILMPTAMDWSLGTNKSYPPDCYKVVKSQDIPAE